MSTGETSASPSISSTLTPPVKRYAGVWEVLLIGLYYAFVGIFLIQNAYGFWPGQDDYSDGIATPPVIDTRYLDSVKTELKNKVKSINTPPSQKDSPELIKIQNMIAGIDTLRKDFDRFKTSVSIPDTVKIRFLHWGKNSSIPSTRDQALLVLVLVMGALGSWLHGIASYLAFIGNRNFITSWIPWYLLRPAVGACLAMVFYVVVRAGFYQNTTSVSAIAVINPFSIAALAALVGLFSQRATKKLADVFEAMFPSKQEDRDPLEAKSASATIVQLTPSNIKVGATDLKVKMSGNGFTDKLRVFVNGKERTTAFTDRENIEFSLNPEDVTAAGNLTITLQDPTSAEAPAKAKLTVEAATA